MNQEYYVELRKFIDMTVRQSIEFGGSAIKWRFQNKVFARRGQAENAARKQFKANYKA